VTVPIYRAPMRARNRDLPPGAGADYCLHRGLVGIGPGDDTRRDELVHRFATVEDGVFVWTRDGGGAYRLGRIDGPLREDSSSGAGAVGITHIRGAKWLADPVPEADVPDAVRRTFARGGRNFQRTRDAVAERLTGAIWQRAAG
jgi:hypothetical protein